MIKVANAPCSWGVLEFDLAGEAAGYEQVLDEMAATGYVGTELGDWGFMPTDAVQLAAELGQRELAMLAAFVPVNLKDASTHAAGAETAVRTAQLLKEVGGRFVVLADDNGRDPERTQNAGRITAAQGLSEAEWQVFAEGVNMIAQQVQEATGLRLVFHHHCAGYVETPTEIDKLLTLTDPKLVGLCFDTGHYRFGGGEPLAGLQTHWERIWHVHFKDCHPAVAAASREQGWDYFKALRHGVFCELGQGDVDFPAIVAFLHDKQYDGWIVVEQDVLPGMGRPYESAGRNRAYLRSIGL